MKKRNSIIFTLLVAGLVLFTVQSWSSTISWDGEVDNQDWNTNGNWDPDQVPTSNDNVTISLPLNTTFDLLIKTGPYAHYIKSLLIDHPSGNSNNVKLEISSGINSNPAQFKVKKSIILNGHSSPGQAIITQKPYTIVQSNQLTLYGATQYTLQKNATLSTKKGISLKGQGYSGSAAMIIEGTISSTPYISLRGNGGTNYNLCATITQTGNSSVNTTRLELGENNNHPSMVSYDMLSGQLQAAYITLKAYGGSLRAKFNQQGGKVTVKKSLFIGEGTPHEITSNVIYNLFDGKLVVNGNEYIGTYMDSAEKGSALFYSDGGQHIVKGDLRIGPAKNTIGARQNKYQSRNGNAIIKGDLYIDSNKSTFSSMLILGNAKMTVQKNTYIGMESTNPEDSSFNGLMRSKFYSKNIYVKGTFSSSGTVKIASNGVMRILKKGRLYLNGEMEGGTIYNQGKARLQQVQLNHTNIANTGDMTLSGTGTGKRSILNNKGKIYIGTNGSIGAFDFSGNFINSGTIEFDIYALNYDYLSIGGKATLSGNLEVSIPHGKTFDFQVGSIFDIIYAQGGINILPDFDIFLPELEDQRQLNWFYDNNHLYLRVDRKPNNSSIVPEPSSALLLLIGILGLKASRRKTSKTFS